MSLLMGLLYNLVVVVSMHWGNVPTTSHIVTHQGISLEACQNEARNWVFWQNDLKAKMNGNGDVAVYPACIADGRNMVPWWAR